MENNVFLVIDGQKYRMVFDKYYADKHGNEGSVSGRTGNITIDASFIEDRQKQTLFHEIMELINEHNELNLPHNVIQIISNAYFSHLETNGLLIKNLLKKLGG